RNYYARNCFNSHINWAANGIGNKCCNHCTSKYCVWGIIGRVIKLEAILNWFGEWVTSKFKNKDNSFNIGQGFVTASLIFGVGAMAILGSLDSGLRGDHELLMTKAVLDGFTALVLTSTLGIGVIFSAIPVFLFQGAVTVSASQIEAIIPSELLHQQINEITAVGGLIIVAIGLNLL